MPYIIAFVIIVVAAGALLLFRQPAEAPSMPDLDTTTQVPAPAEITDEYVAPTGNPPAFDTPAESADTTPQTPSAPTATAPSRQFTAETSYLTPRREEHIMDVSLTLEGTTVVAANVVYDKGGNTTPQNLSFDSTYKTEVIGKNISDIQLSRVGGASLTSMAFNDAVTKIKAQI